MTILSFTLYEQAEERAKKTSSEPETARLVSRIPVAVLASKNQLCKDKHSSPISGLFPTGRALPTRAGHGRGHKRVHAKQTSRGAAWDSASKNSAEER